ncbi:MAG: rhomboid family intramembrane serine protease [Bacteroidetes bacterium]|nr:rhomboid family intramembrane serine protease [Bacteroidota bacterium]
MSVTIILIGITLVASLLAFNNEDLMRKWILNPYLVHHKKQWWRMITSGFIHADFMHLFFNLFAFYGFGMAVENYYAAIFEEKGIFFYLLLYLGAIVIANGPSLNKNKDNHYYNSLGASGAVSAVIFAAILFQPWSKIYFFGVIGIPGILMGPLYLFIEYRMGKQGGTGINHDAHFWGAIFGLLFTLALKPKLLLYFFDQLMSGF